MEGSELTLEGEGPLPKSLPLTEEEMTLILEGVARSLEDPEELIRESEAKTARELLKASKNVSRSNTQTYLKSIP